MGTEAAKLKQFDIRATLKNAWAPKYPSIEFLREFAAWHRNIQLILTLVICDYLGPTVVCFVFRLVWLMIKMPFLMGCYMLGF